MTGESDVSELLLRWRELRQQGLPVTAEDVCKDVPGLLAELKRRIAAVEAMEQRLGLGTVTEGAAPGPESSSAATIGAAAVEASSIPMIDPLSVPGYELLEVLGQGGMGVVYRARQIKLKRLVAVKMLRNDFHPRPQQMARFWGEAEAVAKLQHPHIIQVYDFGEADGRPYFSMELVEGGNLAQKLAGNPMPPAQAAEIVAMLADAVHYAHQRGVVHRDLKPANILIQKEAAADTETRSERKTVSGAAFFSTSSVVKITDFGLAKRLYSDSNGSDVPGHQTQSGVILGTPSYMAPEQAAGKSKDTGPLTDVYALGAILYEMLTGRPPFVGESPLDTVLQVMSSDPVPPSREQPAVPRDLETICLKCLEKSPGRRYATAVDLADDLRRYLQGQPIKARSASRLRRLVRWGWRRPALVIVLALVLLGRAMWSQHQQHEQARQAAVQLAPRAREILHKYCYECHGQDLKNMEKDLNVLDYQALLDDPRHVVVPGEVEGSELIRRIEDDSMPPTDEDEYPRLSSDERALLKRWVAGGAPAFADLKSEPLPPEPAPTKLAIEVKEIFSEKCAECHFFNKAKKGIKILNHDLLVAKRKVVLPGAPENSLLYQILVTTDKKKLMPPPESANPLTDEEKETIRRWIAEGAPPFPRVRAETPRQKRAK
jgi:serine/threonine protein kinase/mono/diheme cytochrome c family protein